MVKNFLIALMLLPLLPIISPAAGVDVLVGRYDQRGAGANLHETVLNTSNVNPASFGKLFSYEVEGFVYAQPLIVSGVHLRGRLRNLVYVATTNDMVYALDADDPGPDGGLLWQVRLTDHGAFPAPSIKATGLTVQGNIGILSTPVIDRARGAIYVVARSLGSKGYLQRLHALDLLTGAEKTASPVDISPASIDRDGITFPFHPEIQSNRVGLALSGSKIIIAWSGIDDDRGWVMAYDAGALQRTGIFCTTCARAVPFTDADVDPKANCSEQPPLRTLIGGGIWQSGRPPVVDANGYVYFFTANGWTHGCHGKLAWYATACSGLPGEPKPRGYYAESLLKLDPGNGLTLVGSWTPATWCELDRTDNDLGGSGPALIDFTLAGLTTRTFAVGGGKEGHLYTIETNLITHPDLVEGQSVTALHGELRVVEDNPSLPCHQSHPTMGHHVMGGPVFWPRSTDGLVSLFLSVENDCVLGFKFTSGLGFDPTPVTFTSDAIEGHPGAILSLSANGDREGSGILWMTHALSPPGQDATLDTRRGRLAAYNAENLSQELWSSDMVADGRDSLGYFAKFNSSTIANGKVYAASFPTPEPYKTTGNHTYHAANNVGYLVVYGLNPPPQPPVKSFVPDLLPSILAPLSSD